MNQYEVMYVIDTALEEQARQDTVARFAALVEQNGGQVDRIDEWGKRRLAYAIDYKTEGYYVLMYVTAPPALPRELERNLQNADAILRYLVIRFEGALPPKREPLRPFAPAQAAEAEPETPAVEAAPAAEEAPKAPVAEEAAEPVQG
ncbi:30S ribosomal protein S6 [Bacillota bacterium Meth-B3]|nr:30S ribosomal protein S6 [Christensenellaceae bacterium]MEA5066675.1 30S ribosomal protein S6 [Eubacteriales bacterium]MEA5067506.1 30S ribosomal protein S6 [Christensenellaceae bacterium]